MHPSLIRMGINMNSEYVLANLSIREVISYFKELEIVLTEDYFSKPNSTNVLKFYTQILEIYTGKNVLDITVDDYSIAMLNFIKQLTDFLSSIGLSKLTVKEILNPDGRKFLIICTYIVNYSAFRDEQREVYDRGCTVVTSNINMIEDHKRRLEVIEDNKNKLISSQKENSDKIKHLSECIDAMENESLAMTRTLEQMQGDYVETKSELNEANDKLSTVELTELNLKNEIKVLQKEIIVNPEKLYEIADELKLLLDKDMEIIKNINSTIINTNTKLKSYHNKNRNIKLISELVRSTQEASTAIGILEKSFNTNNTQIKMTESNIKNKNIKVSHLNKQICLLEDKIQGLSQKDKEVSELMATKIHRVKKEYTVLCHNKAVSGKELDENKKKVQELMQEKSKIEQDYFRECNEINGQILILRTKVEIMRLNN